MNPKPIIFLDMDGVLFDFVAAFGKVLNIPDIKDQLTLGVRNIAPQIGMTEDEMWEKTRLCPVIGISSFSDI